MKFNEIELLIDALSSLPSISKKSAEKIVYFLLNQNESFLDEIISRINNLKCNLSVCDKCNCIISDNSKCTNCSNEDQKKEQLVILTNYQDIEKILIALNDDNKNLLFILNAELNYKDKKTEKIDSLFLKIKELIKNNNFKSILLATDLTINGELTANYIIGLIKNNFKDLNIYRLATGMPFNSSIDYIDIDSLKYSIKNKIKI